MKHQIAQLLRCAAWHLDPRGDIREAQARYRLAITKYATAEQELLAAVRARPHVAARGQ